MQEYSVHLESALSTFWSVWVYERRGKPGNEAKFYPCLDHWTTDLENIGQGTQSKVNICFLSISLEYEYGPRHLFYSCSVKVALVKWQFPKRSSSCTNQYWVRDIYMCPTDIHIYKCIHQKIQAKVARHPVKMRIKIMFLGLQHVRNCRNTIEGITLGESTKCTCIILMQFKKRQLQGVPIRSLFTA